jgi:hypothetical protein
MKIGRYNDIYITQNEGGQPSNWGERCIELVYSHDEDVVDVVAVLLVEFGWLVICSKLCFLIIGRR